MLGGLQDGDAANPIQSLFGVSLHTQLTCQETGEEMSEDAEAFSLKCNISIDINLLHQGMALALKDDREKNSSVTRQLAKFEVRQAGPSNCWAALHLACLSCVLAASTCRPHILFS